MQVSYSRMTRRFYWSEYGWQLRSAGKDTRKQSSKIFHDFHRSFATHHHTNTYHRREQTQKGRERAREREQRKMKRIENEKHTSSSVVCECVVPPPVEIFVFSTAYSNGQVWRKNRICTSKTAAVHCVKHGNGAKRRTHAVYRVVDSRQNVYIQLLEIVFHSRKLCIFNWFEHLRPIYAITTPWLCRTNLKQNKKKRISPAIIQVAKHWLNFSTI